MWCVPTGAGTTGSAKMQLILLYKSTMKGKLRTRFSQLALVRLGLQYTGVSEDVAGGRDKRQLPSFDAL